MNCFDNSHDHRGRGCPTSTPPTNLPAQVRRARYVGARVLRAGASLTQSRGLPSKALFGSAYMCWEAPVSTERTSVGLDVHARSVVAAAIDGVTGEVFRARLTPGNDDVLGWVRALPGPSAVSRGSPRWPLLISPSPHAAPGRSHPRCSVRPPRLQCRAKTMDAGDEGFSGKTVRRPESGRSAARPRAPTRESQQSPQPIVHRHMVPRRRHRQIGGWRAVLSLHVKRVRDQDMETFGWSD